MLSIRLPTLAPHCMRPTHYKFLHQAATRPPPTPRKVLGRYSSVPYDLARVQSGTKGQTEGPKAAQAVLKR